MASKKIRKRVLPLVFAGILAMSSLTVFAAEGAPEGATDGAPEGGGVMEIAEVPATPIPVDFILEWNDDGTIKDIDMERYAYYVAGGQALKNAPAFTNAGTSEAGMSENNLFGALDDEYGYVSEIVWDLEAGGEAGVLHAKYGTWADYQAAIAATGTSLEQQSKMVDSIAYLAEGTADIADYWYVRHGSLDRDTGFANQALLSLAMKSQLGKGIVDINYKFAYGQGHAGNYDNAEAYAYFTDKTDPATGETVVPAGEATPIEFTLADGDAKTTVKVTRYTSTYLPTQTEAMTDELYANAKVNIYVPEGATAATPVIYMVDNSGWQSDAYSDTLIVSDGTMVSSGWGPMATEAPSEGYAAPGGSQSDLAAKALADGYIVINAGLRCRNDANTNSPVTVADAKAVISYVRSLGLGETMWISGTSGGGALSVAIASSGNSADYAAELERIGAVEGKNDVQGTIAYCPITDLGHADGSYEYTYAAARQMLLDAGFTSADEATGFILSESTMTVSPKLAAAWAEYANGLGIAGTDNAFDTATLTGSGTVYAEMENMVIAALNEGLAAAGDKDAFLAELSTRTYATTGGFMGGFYVDTNAEAPADVPADEDVSAPAETPAADSADGPGAGVAVVIIVVIIVIFAVVVLIRKRIAH